MARCNVPKLLLKFSVVSILLGLGSSSTLAETVHAENAFLELSLDQLLNITVTSVAKREQQLSDAAAAIFVITQEDILRSGATTLPDALAMAPGIQVAKITASKWSVSSRGFPGLMSNKLLVLIDGRSVYSPLYSGVFWDQNIVMLEDVDRIEIIRGPGGTLWGANAVNGVINIITKNAEETQGGLVRVSVGDDEPFSTALRYGGKIGETTYARLYALYEDHGSNTLQTGGADADDDWRPLQAGFRMDGSPGNGREWTLQGDAYKNTGDLILSPYWIDGSVFPQTRHDKVDVRGANLLGRWQQEVSPDSRFIVQAYFDNAERDETLYTWQHNTLDLDLQYETTLGQRQRLSVGAGYRSVKIRTQPNYQVYIGERNDDLYSVFVQDEINLVHETLWLTLGTKYEYNDYTGSEWQPSGRLLWKPTDGHSLWASVARAVVTPTVVERDSQVVVGKLGPTLPYTFGGTADSRSEELLAYELGYRWQAYKHLSFDLAVFYNEYDDLFTMIPPTGQSTQLAFTNGVSGHGSGIELAADWQATDWLGFKLSYSFLNMKFSPKAGIAQEILSTRYNDGSPQHQVSLRSSIVLGKDWRLNLWGRYIDEIQTWDMLQAGWPLVTIDDYFLFNANLIWTPTPHLEIMIAGENLFADSRWQYTSEYSTPPTEIDQRVYGKLTWRF